MIRNNFKSGQIAIEFLFVIGLILLLSIFVLYDVFTKKDQITDTSDFLLKKDLCLEVSSLITGVYSKGPGTEAYLNVNGEVLFYNLTIQPNARHIFVGDEKSAHCTIPISSVSNNTDIHEVVPWFSIEFNSTYRVLRFKNIGRVVLVTLHTKEDLV